MVERGLLYSFLLYFSLVLPLPNEKGQGVYWAERHGCGGSGDKQCSWATVAKGEREADRAAKFSQSHMLWGREAMLRLTQEEQELRSLQVSLKNVSFGNNFRLKSCKNGTLYSDFISY